MQIDHIHFYVPDACATRDWFVRRLGFQGVGAGGTIDTWSEVVRSGCIYVVISSPLCSSSPIAHFLAEHPPGVVDVAFRVPQLTPVLTHAIAQGATLLQPLQISQTTTGFLEWGQIAAWGTLRHTLLARTGITALLPSLPHLQVQVEAMELTDRCTPNLPPIAAATTKFGLPFTSIDHVVVNVAIGQLEQAIHWYEQVLGFQPQQMFEIRTAYSGLCSRVMVHPNSQIKLPINEPTTATSQIQEFLDVNRGAGVQHIALHTDDILSTIAQLRARELPLLQVPTTYYDQLRQRLPQFNWQAIETAQVLVDWQDDVPQAMLLQTFTQPIFEQPTFFFEVIERQPYWNQGQSRRVQGFGEGNFRALFEAIEQEQMKRGTLKSGV
ncbi:MAG: 4-hydroxyphenylpyruvate dioxygenase [Scytolyngbya sp. HA4215-MV1]|nr:4-hydroxyphenylpyruvate dioxygenase [Scytolyngbya sp. HA4215-MV1]